MTATTATTAAGPAATARPLRKFDTSRLLPLIGPLALARPLAGQPWFALGAMAASLAWFVVLALASARLGGAFQRAWTWRALDLGVTVIVSILAVDIFMDLARRHWTG